VDRTPHRFREAFVILGALLVGRGCAQSEAPIDAGAGAAGSNAAGADGAGAGTGGGREGGTTGSGGSAAGGFGGATGGSGGAPGAAAGRGGGSGGGGNAGGGVTGAGTAGRGGAGGGMAGNGAAGRGGGGSAGNGAAGLGGSGGSAGNGSAGRGGSAGGASGSAGIGGGSLCAAGRFLLCEGFEGPVGNTPPSGWTRQGNATIAEDQAARGAHALKLTPAADKGYGFFVYGNAESFGAAHWGRLFYRVQAPPPDAFVHATMAAYQGDGPEIGAATFRVVDTVKMAAPTSTHQFLYNVQITGGSEFSKQGPYSWTFDGNWHCAEWFVDGANQAYQFFQDGAEVTQMRIQNGAGNYGSGSNRTNLPMMFNDFRVGWTTYQTAAPGFTAWIDEVAIDAQRVGCGN
jgi:hypothetical protein